MFVVPSASPTKRRRKLKQLNKYITCPLCHGYLIEATTIIDCVHSFCRSCIVTHLNRNKYCPCCDTNKQIQLTHLRPDNQLRSIVYKLVAGLYESEIQKRHAFYEQHNKTSVHNIGEANGSNNTSSNVASHSASVYSNEQIDLCGTKEGSIGNEAQRKRTTENNDITTTHHLMLNTAVASSSHIDDKIYDDVEFYSADDPISLSLEYHPKSLTDCDKSSIPAIKYLQCPAAVTVYHLQRLLSSKFSLNYKSSTSSIDINIIYEDEILPTDFTLMDVAYCYNWMRLEPLRLYYQILINTSYVHQQKGTVPESTHLENTSNNSKIDTNNSSSENRCSVNIKNTKQTQNSKAEPHVNKHVSKEHSQTISDDNLVNKVDKNITNKSDSDSYNRYSISIDNPIKPTKVTLVKNNSNKQNIVGNSENNNKNVLPKAKSGELASTKVTVSDFKSLRSNDIKYSIDIKDVKPAKVGKSLSTAQQQQQQKHQLQQQSNKSERCNETSIKTKYVNPLTPPTTPTSGTPPKTINHPIASSTINTLPNNKKQSTDDLRKPEHKHKVTQEKVVVCNKNVQKHINSVASATAAAITTNPNVVVSIPQNQRISLSDENVHSLSLPMLKTANKKSKTNNYKQSISVDEGLLCKYMAKDDVKPDIPKLKIELSSLKKKSCVDEKSRSSSTSQSKSYDFSSSNYEIQNQVDLTEYAKHIGLKPIARAVSADESMISPRKCYDNADENDKSLHKKRKKSGKHSKEPGSKRRKLHAEISSQEEESLKLKVKITANKSSKHERKSSGASSSDDSIGTQQKDDYLSPDDNQNRGIVDNITKGKLLELRQVRHKPSKNSSCESPDKDVIITGISFPTISTTTTTPTSLEIFVKPKPVSQESKCKVTNVHQTVPKIYLPGMRTISRAQLPNIRPIVHPTGRIFIPPHMPNYANICQQRGVAPVNANFMSLKRPSNTDVQTKLASPQKNPKIDPVSRKACIPNLIRTVPIHTMKAAAGKPVEPFYNSTMSSTYTQEITTKKPTPIFIPPSSISVTKMTDIPKHTTPSSTITKPVLEIVRISSNIPAIDEQHNNSLSSRAITTTTHTNRPLPQTIPLAKIRKAGTSAVTTVVPSKPSNGEKVDNTFRIPIALPHNNPVCDNIGALDLSSMKYSPPYSPTTTMPPSPGKLAAFKKVSIKSPSPPIEIIDITTPPKSVNKSEAMPNNIDAHKKQKIKIDVEHGTNSIQQNSQHIKAATNPTSIVMKNLFSASKKIFSSNTTTSSTSSSINKCVDGTSSHMKINATPDVVNTSMPDVTTSKDSSEHRLQNLQMLSESALKREKLITASTTAAITSTVTVPSRQLAMPKLNEINKIIRTQSVHQQNASVRNIPNPSALAFRNQGMNQKQATHSPPSTSTAASTTASAVATPASPNTSQIISPTFSIDLLTSSKAPNTSINSTISAVSTSVSTKTSRTVSSSMPKTLAQPFIKPTIYSSNSATSSSANNNDSNEAKLLAAKKNLHLEKLAASLRAAASENNSGNSLTTVA